MLKKILLPLAIAATSAHAIDFTYTQTGCGGSLAAFPAACTAFTNEINNEINNNLPDVSLDKYADGTANANVIANTGKGSDYGQNFDLFTLKLTPLSIGVDASEGGLSNPEEASGFAIGGGVMAGLNMDLLPVKKIGFIDLSRLDLMFNFMSFNMDQSSGNLDASGKLSGLGIMARYTLIKPTMAPGKLAGWGGLHLHTGFQTAKMNINVKNKLDDETFTTNSGGATVTGSFTDGILEFDLDANTTAIPLELSTYVRFLYAFTLYGGVGIDLASGDSDITFAASGNVSANGGDYTGTLTGGGTSKGKPESSNLRGFIGLQINVPVVSLFIHVNKHLSQDVLGLNAGLNITW